MATAHCRLEVWGALCRGDEEDNPPEALLSVLQTRLHENEESRVETRTCLKQALVDRIPKIEFWNPCKRRVSIFCFRVSALWQSGPGPHSELTTVSSLPEPHHRKSLRQEIDPGAAAGSGATALDTEGDAVRRQRALLQLFRDSMCKWTCARSEGRLGSCWLLAVRWPGHDRNVSQSSPDCRGSASLRHAFLADQSAARLGDSVDQGTTMSLRLRVAPC